MNEKNTAHGRSAIWVLSSVLILALIIPPFAQFPRPVVAAEGSDESEHQYHNDPMTYLLFTFLMTFSSMSIIVSIFTLKFGQRKAKLLSLPLLASGIITWAIWIYFNLVQRAEFPDDTILGIIHWVAAPLLKPIMAVLGFLMGVAAALSIFLTMVVRS